MAITRQMKRTVAAKGQNEANQTTAKDAQRKPDTTSSSTLGLLDLPPELRNSIYRYILVSNQPIAIQFESDRHSKRCHFTMIPALTLVSKQLRLETQRLFLEENEFQVGAAVLQERYALAAFRRMHQLIGLELQTIHVSYSILKRCGGRHFQLEAELTLNKVEGRIIIAKQAYHGKSFHFESPATLRSTYVRHMEVCGCRVQTLVHHYNTHFTSNDLVILLLLLEHQTGGRPTHPIRDMLVVDAIDGVSVDDILCPDCSEEGPPNVLWF